MGGLANNRLIRKLAEGKGVVAYITAGDGGLDRTLDLLRACEDAGVVLVELGIPFSDPMADGPILQAAAQRALEGGAHLSAILDTLAKFRATSELPVAIFSYANPLYRKGLGAAFSAMREAGADAVLVPDLPLEEAEPLCLAAEREGICPVLFAAPTTEDERLAAICARTRGFVYAIGRRGVTGSSTHLDPGVETFLSRVLDAAQTPVGVGFGLRTPEQIDFVLQRAHLAIVGSALVEHIHRAEKPAVACFEFLRRLTGK
jgi:tryptophan synthase alpha chain